MHGASTFEIIAIWSVLGVAIAGLLYALFLTLQILRADQGDEKMRKISNAIKVGANTYLNRQFRAIAFLIVILAILLYFTTTQGPHIALGRAGAFLMGSIFSALVGYIGMGMAVRGNVRVASAARRSFAEALKIAYRSGTITGMLTDGLGLLGGTTIFIIFGKEAPEVLLGFGFGGCLLALFMRVGGGIYTKAADVGADLVGKVEKNIPEDDPRNAAVIADLVGDNVGDCAGMAADIFESYEVTIVSAMLLGLSIAALKVDFELKWIVFPLLVRASGVFSSIIGTYAVRALKEVENAMEAIHRGYWLSAIISIAAFFIFAHFYFKDLRVFFSTSIGIFLAVSFNYLTDYFTSTEKAPVKEIARSSQTGAATVILRGLAVGYESTVWAIIVIAISIIASALIWQGMGFQYILYGVALCGIGQLTLTGNNISMDAFGPISDNANGIGEMAHMEPKARQIMADLDAVGNTTKAITKGIAIGSAVIAAVSLFGAFTVDLKLGKIDVSNPVVFIGMLIGGAIPFLFSSLAIRAVGRAAFLIVKEIRRQFAEIPGLWEGRAEPDYAKPVAICTTAAQRELIGLGLISILSPILVGFVFKAEALGGFLAGIILVGQLLAVFMANAGGAWDNAKKSIEDGFYGGKGSDCHKASVIGDTVGDPLKDTAGPALNPMIKVINLVSLLVAPLVIMHRGFPLGVIIISSLSLILIIGAVLFSKREGFKEKDLRD
ncbi:MAG: sodium-translocating pyrophosphatase [candidate division WOR-3 bacterium]